MDLSENAGRQSVKFEGHVLPSHIVLFANKIATSLHSVCARAGVRVCVWLCVWITL